MKQLILSIILLFFVGNAQAQKPDTKVSLGIKPDYFFSGDGVRVKEPVKDKTAYKAGIKAGDVITAFDKTIITGIFQYRDLLNQYKSGDKVKVTIKRNEKLFSYDIQFE